MCLLSFSLSRLLARNEKKRSDNHPALPFYFAKDLDLKEQRFSFRSGKNVLHGSFYQKSIISKRPLIVFFHGLGSGRLAYTRLIAAFCEKGYEVVSFDYTGCGESEGKWIGPLTHVYYDLEAFFTYLKSLPHLCNREIFTVGHSWGGYAALLSLDSKFSVQKSISFSGFSKYSLEISHYFPAKLRKFLLPIIKETLFWEGGVNGDRDALKIIKNTSSKLLHIQGEEDCMVPLFAGIMRIEECAKKNQNIKTILLPKKGHQPYLTLKAEKHYTECIASGILSLKPSSKKSLNLSLATELDKNVMNVVFDFLEG